MLYNRFDDTPRSRYNEQVHYARHAFKMDCIDSRPNYPMINTVMAGVADITRLRVQLAVIPVIVALRALEQSFASIGEYDAQHQNPPRTRSGRTAEACPKGTPTRR